MRIAFYFGVMVVTYTVASSALADASATLFPSATYCDGIAGSGLVLDPSDVCGGNGSFCSSAAQISPEQTAPSFGTDAPVPSANFVSASYVGQQVNQSFSILEARGSVSTAVNPTIGRVVIEYAFNCGGVVVSISPNYTRPYVLRSVWVAVSEGSTRIGSFACSSTLSSVGAGDFAAEGCVAIDGARGGNASCTRVTCMFIEAADFPISGRQNGRPGTVRLQPNVRYTLSATARCEVPVCTNDVINLRQRVDIDANSSVTLEAR